MPPNPDHIKRELALAEEMLRRAQGINAAQYAHGINSARNSIEFYIRSLKNEPQSNYNHLNALREKTMQLGGYLYALKEKI